MREVNATDLKNLFSEFLEFVREEPVGIRKSGKLIAVMISAEDYERFQRLDAAYWTNRAETAAATGDWLDHDAAVRALTQRLKKKS